jgi:O-antigen ligase
MLPVAIWAAPPPLREQYSWPRSYILIWNFSLFWSILAYASQTRRALGWALVGWIAAVQAIAMLAPFGMEARAKLPVIGSIQDLIPRPLMGLFSGAESGFSTNQVAGVLLYVLPLLLAMCGVGLRTRGWRWWLLLFCTGWMGATLVLTQSRGGLLGMLMGTLALLLLSRRWGWTALAALAAIGATFVFYLPPGLLEVISDAPGVDTVGGVVTIQNFRLLVWQVANSALADFPFTGIGLGTFRVLIFVLYALPGIPAGYDLAHAHNFFLQTGLDFGVPGLVAILVVYVAAIVQLVRLAHLPTQDPIWQQLPFLTPRVLATGWMGCLVGQTVYSLFDAVAMGSKPNFGWWWWMALILATASYLRRDDGRAPHPNPPQTGRE